MKNAILGVTAILLAVPALSAHAETPAKPDLDTICAARACRTNFYNAVLRVDDKHYRTVPVSRAPYVLDNGEILIYPGETLAITFKLENGMLVQPSFVKSYAAQLPVQIQIDGKPSVNPDDSGLPKLATGTSSDMAGMPPNTLVISYGQVAGKPDMMLTVNGNLPKTLKLDAQMFLFSDKVGYVVKPTSTCPMLAGTSLFENWPEPLGPMVLSHVRLLNAGDKMVCQ